MPTLTVFEERKRQADKQAGGHNAMYLLKRILRTALTIFCITSVQGLHISIPTLAAWLEGRKTSVMYLICCDLPDEFGDLTQKTCVRRHTTVTNTNVS